MATWRPTSDDRDAQGFIKAAASTPDTTEAAQLYEETRQAIEGATETPAPAEATEAAGDRPPPARPPISADTIRAVVAVALLLIAAAIWAWWPTTTPASTRPLAASTSAPATLAPTAPPAPLWIDAFAAPNGDVIGPVDANTIRYHILARSGAEWVQVDAGGAIGNVWFRQQDLPLDQDDLAALAAVPDVATPTAAPRPTDPPVPTSAPTPPCDPDTAPYRVERPILGQGDIPLGRVTGVSCVSQAEAEANADQWEQSVRTGATATAAARPASDQP